MKKLIYLAVIFFLVVSFQNIFAQSYNGWFFVNPKPQASTIISCDFINENTGYALCANGSLLKTTNFGTNWTFHSHIIPGNVALKKLYIQNETTFFIIGTNGGIFKSTNSGISFITQSASILSSLNCIHFVNANTGIIGTLQYFLRTTNGGTNWVNLFNPSLSSINSLAFINEQTGFATINGGVIAKTTNAGLNWISIQTPTSNNLNPITFVNSNTGFACGNAGTIIKTTNGGNNWFIQTAPINTQLKTINFFNETTGFVLCYKDTSNYLLITTNGGNQWEDFVFSQTFEIQTSCIVSPQRAFAGGDYGQMFRSDGVSFWNTVSSLDNTFDFIDIDFINSITGYGIADNGKKVLKTSNGGNNWQQISTLSSDYTIRWLGFLDENTGVISAHNLSSSHLYRTTNGGQNWNIINVTPTDQFLIKPLFINSIGYLTGTDGFYKSTNAGLNWIRVSSNYLSDNVMFVNSEIGYAIQPSHKLFKTTNGGNNWQNIYNVDPTNYFIASVDFFDENNGVVVCVETIFSLDKLSYILKTSNGGISWDSIKVRDTLSLYKRSKFINPQKGFVTTGQGVYYTLNSGMNWNYIPFLHAHYQGNGTVNLSKIYFLNQNTGFMYGFSGLMTKTTTGGSVFINNETQNIPTTHMLFQNYPNPFNPSTTISFYLKKTGLTKLNVYDISGRLVAELINENRPSGFNQVAFNPENLSSGVYFYQLETDDYKESKKMVLIK